MNDIGQATARGPGIDQTEWQVVLHFCSTHKIKKAFYLKDLMTKALTKIAVSIDEYFSWKILKIWPHQAQLNPSKFKMSFI